MNDDLRRQHRAAWARRRRRLIAYGRWNPTEQIDPTPVREHIASLRALGLSVQTIADLAGENAGPLAQLIYPNHGDYLKWITRERAERLLAVRFDLDAIPPGRNVDATGTRRRIEALMRLGWSQAHIGEALGVSRQRVSKYRGGAHVQSDTARAVRDLFDKWWDKTGPEIRVVNKAIREGFPPPLAWDDIDDPNEAPHLDDADVVDEVALARLMAGDPVEATRDERREAVRRLAEAGHSDADIAGRLNITDRTVQRWRVELGIESRWAA